MKDGQRSDQNFQGSFRWVRRCRNFHSSARARQAPIAVKGVSPRSHEPTDQPRRLRYSSLRFHIAMFHRSTQGGQPISRFPISSGYWPSSAAEHSARCNAGIAHSAGINLSARQNSYKEHAPQGMTAFCDRRDHAVRFAALCPMLHVAGPWAMSEIESYHTVSLLPHRVGECNRCSTSACRSLC